MPIYRLLVATLSVLVLSTEGASVTVVYGATPGGIIGAVASARAGVPTMLLTPTPAYAIGGMVAGGLGHSDIGNRNVIGGFAGEFFQRVGAKYGSSSAIYDFEPSVARAVFNDMINAEADLTLVADWELASVERDPSTNRLHSVTNSAGATVSGAIFVDASYEGDLLHAAGVHNTIGRESDSEFNETTNGRTDPISNPGGIDHQFHVPVVYTNSSGSLLPMVYGGSVAPVGHSDTKVQAYNFRMCLTTNTSNMIPLSKPADYDPSYWQLARNWMKLLNGSMSSLTDFMIVSPLPNQKTDINNHGPISTDFIGGSWGWPAGDAATRKAIYEAHKSYTLSFFYFLGHDDSVPQSVRNEMLAYGFAKDEFVETGGFPPQLYVREGRRMVGDFVFTELDRTTNKLKTDSVGLGSYNIDNHHAERILLPHDNTTWVLNEGNTEAFHSDGPFELPYRTMLPSKSDAPNLLAPVPVSASHSGFGSIRLEPQWMILGQAAGTASALFVSSGVASVHDVNVTSLQSMLIKNGALLHASDVANGV